MSVSNHKFRTGQTVTVLPSQYLTKIVGGFKIVRLLPAEHGMCQYRIQSIVDGHERVVMECEVV